MYRGGEAGALSAAGSLPSRDEFADLTPDQRFVVKLQDLGRVRLAARAEVGGRVRGWVEWVNDSGETVEQIEVAAIEALGYTSHTLYNLSGSGSASGLASGASEGGDAGRAGGTVDYAPGQRPDVFPRSPGYAPGTTYTGPVSSL